MDIKALSTEQKKLLLYVLEADLGLAHTDTEAKPTELQLELQKCNTIAKMKKAGQNVVMTEYQF